MSLLAAHALEKSFGALTLLSGVSLRLEWGQRVGLVGPNGAGKTTLMRILSGESEADRGRVARARGLRVGYLRQEQMVDHGLTVYQEAEAAFQPVLDMERAMRDAEARISTASGADLDTLLTEYSRMRDRFDAMGGYDSIRDIRRVLGRLGFAESSFDLPTSSLSGGQKTRLGIAKLLLSGPDVLLLDEPSNHLDLNATEWLEEFLSAFGGALILVSHDRRFLDNVVTSVWELDGAHLTPYNGSFSSYWTQREERRRKADEDSERRAAEIARLEDFWRRNKAGQAHNMAWSRYKAAQKLRAEQHSGPRQSETFSSAMTSAKRSGNEVVITERLTKRFGDKTLFQDLTLLIMRRQRIGIVGPNGSGKSTLLRILIGEEAPTAGRTRLGAGVSVGYFAQEASTLDPYLAVIETLMQVREMLPGEARGFLARFLFTGDDVYKRVEQLSGGEKNRLVLAQLVLDRPNLLVLDEPTNHLDIGARDALADMLSSYDGTLLLASHDRFLLDQVTTHTLQIDQGRGRLFDGPYSEYRRQRRNGVADEQVRTPDAAAAHAGERIMNSFELSRARKRATKVVQSMEEAVANAEDWVKRIEEALARPDSRDDIVKLARDYETAQRELADAMESWEAAMHDAERLGLPA